MLFSFVAALYPCELSQLRRKKGKTVSLRPQNRDDSPCNGSQFTMKKKYNCLIWLTEDFGHVPPAQAWGTPTGRQSLSLMRSPRRYRPTRTPLKPSGEWSPPMPATPMPPGWSSAVFPHFVAQKDHAPRPPDTAPLWGLLPPVQAFSSAVLRQQCVARACASKLRRASDVLGEEPQLRISTYLRCQCVVPPIPVLA